MAAFATPADLLIREDYRVIGQLISDSGIAADQAAVLASPTVAAALAQASGEIVARALVGGRYSEADLLALTGNGQAFLVGLTCSLSVMFFPNRRGIPVDQYPQTEQAMKWLDLLATGAAIFPIAANIAAGVAQSPDISVQTIVNNNHIQNQVRYFPTPNYTLGQLG